MARRLVRRLRAQGMRCGGETALAGPESSGGMGRPRSSHVVRAASLLLFFLAAAGPARAQFRASVVKVDITPDTPQWLLGYVPRQSKAVHDKLHHRVLALQDASGPFVLASTD